MHKLQSRSPETKTPEHEKASSTGGTGFEGRIVKRVFASPGVVAPGLPGSKVGLDERGGRRTISNMKRKPRHIGLNPRV